MKTFFDDLFEYNNHCNEQLAAAIVSHADQVSTKTIRLFSHILNAHHIWNARIRGLSPDLGVWDVHVPGDFAALNLDNYRNTRSFLLSDDLNAVIRYATTKGDAFSNTVSDMLFHVVNHSTYHRGQLAAEMRQSGLEPLGTDYIFYKR